MKAKYLGTPGEDLAGLSMYDTQFPKGEWVKVDHLPPWQYSKLAHHPHFDFKEDPLTAVEDAQIKREFSTAADEALKPIEENKQAEAETIAKLTDEDKYGSDDEGSGDQDAAEAGGDSVPRKRGPGRPRKGT